MSVFWRHRPKEVEQAGYLSDIYLVSAGFWRHFSLRSWRNFEQAETHLPELAAQLLLMAEELLGKNLIDSKAMGEMLFSINDILRDIL